MSPTDTCASHGDICEALGEIKADVKNLGKNQDRILAILDRGNAKAESKGLYALLAPVFVNLGKAILITPIVALVVALAFAHPKEAASVGKAISAPIEGVLK